MTGGDQGNPLGRTTGYPDRYAPELLHPIPRAEGRASLQLGEKLPFSGVDVWNAWELSWLAANGQPVAALAAFRIPCTSTHLVESKSLKLYLNGFANTVFADARAVAETLERDLGRCAGAPVEVRVRGMEEAGAMPSGCEGECLDALDVSVDRYDYDPGLLEPAGDGRISEALYTHLLRSLCPVTGQPDWASVFIRHEGPSIPRAGLLRYLVSFRNHSGFHEQVIERIFMDLLRRYEPDYLSVEGRFTRRGGLDINPFRSTRDERPENRRTVRQ